MKPYRKHVVAVIAAASSLLALAPRVEALGSCVQGYPAEIVEFTQGPTANPAGSVSPGKSNATALIGTPTGPTVVSLGIGGTLTLKFDPPVVNYPAAGALVIDAPVGAASCAQNPERAELSVSKDGVNFTVLGTVCLSGVFDLGALDWAGFIRLRDVTDPADPAFAGNPTDGFDIGSVSGPACLKREYCPVASAPDSRYSSAATTRAFSIPTIGDDLVFSSDAKFEEFGNGTARLIGTLFRSGDPTVRYSTLISFTGRVTAPPAGNPVLGLDASAYAANGGPVDPATWSYYRNWNGMLVGTDAAAGQQYTVVRNGAALQLGVGANNRNLEEGASGAFTSTLAGSGISTVGELNIDLALCAGAPTPTPTTVPPVQTPGSTPTPLPGPGATATPVPTPTPGSGTPLPAPTSTPSQTIFPSCTERDIGPLLARLDGAFLDREALVEDALKLLVRLEPSASNRKFRTAKLAEASKLHDTNWSQVWTIPQKVRSCDPSPICVQVSFEPSRSVLEAGAQALDKLVTTVLKRAGNAADTVRAKNRVKQWRKQHQALLQGFAKDLAQVPASTTTCG